MVKAQLATSLRNLDCLKLQICCNHPYFFLLALQLLLAIGAGDSSAWRPVR